MGAAGILAAIAALQRALWLVAIALSRRCAPAGVREDDDVERAVASSGEVEELVELLAIALALLQVDLADDVELAELGRERRGGGAEEAHRALDAPMGRRRGRRGCVH